MSEKLHDFWELITSERAFVWRVFVIAFILRLIPVLLAYNLSIGLDDMFQYDMLGRSIVSGNGYRWYSQPDLDLIQKYVTLDLKDIHYDPRGIETSFRAPLYPLFLAAVYFIAGAGVHRFFAARLAQAALTALLAPLTYLLAGRLIPEDLKLAHWAGWIVAFYPLLLLFPLALATENLFFVLLLAATLALVLAGQTRQMRYFVAAGLLIALTSLTRSVALPLAAVAGLWSWWLWRERLKAAVLVAVVVMAIAPWIIRNSLLYGRLSPIELSMGYNLYVGYHPQSTGTFAYGPSLDLLTIADDSERDRIGTQEAIDFIEADPGRFWVLAVDRLGYFFGLERRALTYFYSNNFFGYIPSYGLLAAAVVLLVPFVLVCCSAVFGLVGMPWNRSTAIVPAVMLAYLTPHVFLLADDRLHMALVPLLAIPAAFCWRMLQRRSFPALPRGLSVAAGIVVLLLLLNWGLELFHDADKLAVLFGPTGNVSHFPY